MEKFCILCIECIQHCQHSKPAQLCKVTEITDPKEAKSTGYAMEGRVVNPNNPGETKIRWGLYDGHVSDKMIPHGTGVMRFKNGDKYDGPFVNGEMHGSRGTYTWKRMKMTYRGDFWHNFKHGKGELVGKYRGEYQYDRPNGFGVKFNHNQTVAYMGQWRNGKQWTPPLDSATDDDYDSKKSDTVGLSISAEKELVAESESGGTNNPSDDPSETEFLPEEREISYHDVQTQKKKNQKEKKMQKKVRQEQTDFFGLRDFRIPVFEEKK
eukprot:CAMPEP_0202462136 /NCGR_PEP_ID=MMETSP1360-20130828/52697_1 /ASSEMBLY_ACC=CAM_ASM_000848 /TAXON_ID=515479 /ORGANISM="Licmophora paradoxa, Strain CCMP2313" /LENGTH=266 /DNA_ID=CAMNT_0049084477 /DNA_START=244 /DNA_END=1045 /DNA_ORIENTATION=+